MKRRIGDKTSGAKTAARGMRRGFTLVELIVAAIIAVFLAGATATALSQMIKSRAASASHQAAFARADGVATRAALDLQNVMRDANLAFTRLQILNSGEQGAERDDLLMISRSLRPVRPDEAEGDEYEVQYRIMGGASGDTFWRRVDPAHDEFQDGGGVATPIAPGAVAFSVQASDGVTWYDEWNSDSDGLPHAVRVMVTAKSDDGKVKATARRVVAIDRVPIQPPAPDTSATDAAANANKNPSTKAGTSGTNSGASTGGYTQTTGTPTKSTTSGGSKSGSGSGAPSKVGGGSNGTGMRPGGGG